jgi:hypothetical protein
MNEIKCPNCGSQKVIEIMYGYPSGEDYDQVMNKFRKGEIFLGGCCIFESLEKMPKKYCKDCETRF